MTEEKGDARTVDSRRVPTEGGRTVLRTEENWDSNLEAGSVSQDGCIAELSAKFARGDPIVVYNDF